jgi:hypothetical protein
MRHGQQTLWLGLGVGSIALVVGYMVGASSTPIVSVAVPAVFGLVITAVGFLRSTGIEEKISALKKTLDRAAIASNSANEAEKVSSDPSTQIDSLLASVRQELSVTPERLGKVLVFFTVFYIVGLSFGTYARIAQIFSPPTPRHLPWADVANIRRPPTAEDAIDWIGVQEQLLALGYSQAQVSELYAIQVDEWNTRQKDAQAAATPKTGGTNVNPSENKTPLSNILSKAVNGKKGEGEQPRPMSVTQEGPNRTLPVNQRPVPLPSAVPTGTVTRTSTPRLP